MASAAAASSGELREQQDDKAVVAIQAIWRRLRVELNVGDIVKDRWSGRFGTLVEVPACCGDLSGTVYKVAFRDTREPAEHWCQRCDLAKQDGLAPGIASALIEAAVNGSLLDQLQQAQAQAAMNELLKLDLDGKFSPRSDEDFFIKAEERGTLKKLLCVFQLPLRRFADAADRMALDCRAWSRAATAKVAGLQFQHGRPSSEANLLANFLLVPEWHKEKPALKLMNQLLEEMIVPTDNTHLLGEGEPGYQDESSRSVKLGNIPKNFSTENFVKLRIREGFRPTGDFDFEATHHARERARSLEARALRRWGRLFKPVLPLPTKERREKKKRNTPNNCKR